MKPGISKPSQPLKIIVVIVISLIWLGSIYQVKAAPPQPTAESTSLPELPPSPAIDIKTELQPHQSPDINASQPNGRIILAYSYVI